MKRYLLAMMIVAALGLASAGSNVAWGQATRAREAVTLKAAPAAVHANLPAAATDADYARREAQAQDLESWTGGRHEEVVFVTCSCVVIVVLILILI